jgi:NADPH2:quinone reductase
MAHCERSFFFSTFKKPIVESKQMKTNAIRIYEHGGPEVLRWEKVTLPRLKPGEALLRQRAIGLNYIDVYFREGIYQPKSLPFVPGMEGTGIIEEISEPRCGFKVGDHVAYVRKAGAYAEHQIVPTASLVALFSSLDHVYTAALMLKGLTAQVLLKEIYRVRRGDVILVHAVAGGTGSILCQWAHRLGATVIGTASSDEKVALATQLNCDFPINYTRQNFVEQVLKITSGEGVDVVYDGVGKSTFDTSLQCLKEKGLMVSFGNASGVVPPVDVFKLVDRTLFLTRPSLNTFLKRPGFLKKASHDLFETMHSGIIKSLSINQRPLREAAEAHQDLENRRTMGSTVLIP